MKEMLWKKDYSLRNCETLIKNCEIFSFDIFDTLLFRAVKEPNDIFLIVGQQAEKEGLFAKGLTPLQFRHLRVQAQRESKEKKLQTHNGEYTFDEIYQQLPAALIDTEKVKALELEVEKKYTYLNQSVYSFMKHLNKLGKKIILTSDMYLGEQRISSLLRSNNFDFDLIDEIIVSCDLAKSKSHGSLYDHLIKKYAIKPEGIFHIGDNYFSDYYNASRKGLNAVHYNLHENEHLKGLEYEEYFSNNENVPELYSLRKLVGNLTSDIPAENKFFFIFGATVIGPFFTYFTEWVLDVIEEEKIENLYPLMSEGAFFEPLLLNALKFRNMELNIKKLNVSRASTFLATINNYDETFIDKLLDNRKNFRVDSLIDIFGIEPLVVDSKMKSIIEREIKTLTDSELAAVKNFLLSDEITNAVNRNIQARKELLYKYLKDNFALDNFATLDIGYRGSTPTNIEIFLKEQGHDVQALHLLAIAIGKLKDNLSKGIRFRSYAYEEDTNEYLIKNVYRYCHMIETIIHNDVLSTVGYKKVDNSVVPIFEEKFDDDLSIEKKRSIQEGILFFQNVTLNHFADKDKAFHTDIMNKSKHLLNIINRVFEIPIYKEAIELGSFSQKNGFFEMKKYQFIESDELSSFNKVEELFENESLLNKIYWPNGVITLKDPHYLLNRLLYQGNKYTFNVNQYKAIKLVQLILKRKLEKVCVYGAGEAGRIVDRILNLFDVHVSCFVDSNAFLHGHFINGVEVVSLEKALSYGETKFAIGSFVFADEIEKVILGQASSQNIEVETFKYNL